MCRLSPLHFCRVAGRTSAAPVRATAARSKACDGGSRSLRSLVGSYLTCRNLDLQSL